MSILNSSNGSSGLHVSGKNWAILGTREDYISIIDEANGSGGLGVCLYLKQLMRRSISGEAIELELTIDETETEKVLWWMEINVEGNNS